MSLYIGVEGVGLRQSVAIASDSAGNVLSTARHVGMPLSFQTVERDLFRTRLVRLLSELCQKIHRSLNDLRDATLCIGLGGVVFPYEFAVELPGEIRAAELDFGSLICTGDAEIVFASHAQSDTGGAIISHMGAVAFVTTPRKHIRIGGWGPTFGDEGSGYWIGRRALRAIAREHEDGKPESILWQRLNEWLKNPNDVAQVPDWQAVSLLWQESTADYRKQGADPRTALLSLARRLYLQRRWQWRAIASGFVIPVMQAWQQGDHAAKNIVDTAALELAKLYRRASEQVQVSNDHAPLVLYGGVLTHNEPFRGLLLARLAGKGFKPKTIVVNTTAHAMRPACGALLFALGRSTSEALRLPPSKVINNLIDKQEDIYWQRDLKND